MTPLLERSIVLHYLTITRWFWLFFFNFKITLFIYSILSLPIFYYHSIFSRRLLYYPFLIFMMIFILPIHPHIFSSTIFILKWYITYFNGNNNHIICICFTLCVTIFLSFSVIYTQWTATDHSQVYYKRRSMNLKYDLTERRTNGHVEHNRQESY